MKWEKVRLGDVAKVSSSKRIFASQYTKSGVPFYRQKEIIDKKNKNEIINPLFISWETFDDIKKKFGAPNKNDLLITAVGVTLGIPYVVVDEIFYFKDGNLIWLSNFDENIHSKYLYYWINSDIGQKIIWSRTIGSAQPALTIDILKQLEIPVPIFNTQCKIVKILSAYDDLIENNQKQIKLLEEAAQRLYKEWFVDFRFPGYEDTKFIDGIPDGWRKELVGSIIDNIPRRKQIKATDYLDAGAVPIVDQSKNFIAGYTNNIEAIINIEKPVIVFGDHTRVLKYLQFPFAKGADGTQLIVSNETNMPQSLFYCSLIAVDLSNYHYARHFKYLKAETILVPTKDVADRFDVLAVPMFSMIQNLRDISNKLTQARDRLLPKLMSGEIEV